MDLAEDLNDLVRLNKSQAIISKGGKVISCL